MLRWLFSFVLCRFFHLITRVHSSSRNVVNLFLYLLFNSYFDLLLYVKMLPHESVFKICNSIKVFYWWEMYTIKMVKFYFKISLSIFHGEIHFFLMLKICTLQKNKTNYWPFLNETAYNILILISFKVNSPHTYYVIIKLWESGCQFVQWWLHCLVSPVQDAELDMLMNNLKQLL